MPPAISYRTDFTQSGPGSGVARWMQGPVMGAYLAACGDALDLVLDGLRQAVAARFVSETPADALGWIGAERLLPRYPADTDDTYRARLAAAWEVWQLAGTAAGILAALAACGFADAAIYTARDATPPGESSWPPDGDTANWSRFWVFLDVSTSNPFAWQPTVWTHARRWGGGATWGSTATVGEVALVRGVIRTLKAAHEVCAGLYVDLPGGRRLRGRGM
jgi:hypothetical protein